MAIPFSILRNLDYNSAGFNQVKVTGIQQLGYGDNVKLQLQFDTRLWNQPGPWGLSTGSSLADTGYQTTWDVTRAQNGDTGILVDYTGGNVGAAFTGDPGDSTLVHSYALQFLSRLEPVFPGITEQWNGRATLDVPAATRTRSVRIPISKPDSTRCSVVRSASGPATAISPGSAVPSDSRALWKAELKKAFARRTKSCPTTLPGSFRRPKADPKRV